MNNDLNKISDLINEYFSNRGWGNVVIPTSEGELDVYLSIFSKRLTNPIKNFESIHKLNDKIVLYFFEHVDIALCNYKIKNSIKFCFIGKQGTYRKYYSNDGIKVVY